MWSKSSLTKARRDQYPNEHVKTSTNPLAQILDHCVHWLRQMGNEIIKRREAKIEGGEKDTNQDPNFVKELLALHDKYMAVVNEQFAGNSLLQKALKEVEHERIAFEV